MKKLLRFTSGLVTLLLLLFSTATYAQTVLIDPATVGGFESGSDMTANGWTVVNHATTTNNNWYVGSVSTPFAGSNAAYISNDGGVSYAYSTGTTSTSHFYRDVTVPSGETKINLQFQWKGSGEGGWDRLLVYVAPTSVTPVPGTPAANSTALTGATLVYTQASAAQATYTNANIYLPASLAGTSFRLIYTWQNDNSFGTSPAVSVDNISLTSQLPGTFISVATGNWTTASTWDANAVPSAADNVTVSTGHVVTIDAASLGANNVIVNGTLGYGTTPTGFNVNGNLTVNAGGVFNVFSGSTGKTLTVTGDIVNNGSIDVSVGTTTAGNLTLNGTAVQTVSGSGTFGASNAIRNLTFSNTNTATPNIIWSINNVKVAYNLNLTGARINLGSNKMTFGNNAAGNTLTAPVGTGFLSGTFSRFWSTTATGSAITAGTDPTNTTSRYPFLSPTAQNRAMYITRTGTGTGAVAGELAVTYADVAGMTTGLSIADGAYTVTDQHNSNWTVVASGAYSWPGTYTVVILDQGAYPPLNGNSRITLQNATVGGTHQNGTTTPGAQRTGLTTAQLTAGALYIGINSADNQYPCTGTPSPAAATSSVVNACSGASFNLSLQTAMVGIGYTYQWQSSTDNNAFTDITGATNATYAATQTVATYYRLNVTCSGSTGTSASVYVGINPFYNCYCTSAATNTADEEILGVSLNGVTKTSTCASLPANTTGTLSFYTDWRGQGPLTTLQQFGSYPLSLQLGTCGTSNYGRSAKVYIDYNCDGDFADAGEEVYFTGAIASSVANPTTNSTTITIPGTAGPLLTASNTTQVTGMRVVYYETTLNGTAYCGTPSIYGETEDFLVTLQYAPACSGVTNPGNTTATTVLACSGAAVTLGITTPTTGATTSYQWYANNTAITGATNTTYSTTVSGSVTYYCTVTCGNTSTSLSSTPITVNQDVPTNCYCTPVTSSGCTDGDVIARVILNTLDNNSGTGCPSGAGGNGYSNYTTDPALTTTLLPSTTYNCTVYAGQYSEGYAAWIDYNDDGVFDNVTERIGYSNGTVAGSGSVGVLGSSATFPIVLACTPPAGQHRLRVRAMFATNGSAVTPCANNSYGEVEDYLITILAAPACPSTGTPTTVSTDSYTATVSFPLNCATATNYDFEYGPAGFTPGTGTVVANQAVTINAGTATYTLTGLNALTTYDIYVRANCGTSTSAWSTATTATTAEPPCSGTPNTAVASFVGPDAICDGGTALMTTSGATSGVLQLSNQWEMSTNNVNWSPVSGANLPTYQSGTMTAGTYYFRYTTTCLATSQSSTSNEITLTVYAPPTITVSAPNNGVICGTQTITATGASTYVWSPASALSATTGSSVTYNATSNNSITVTGTDANGCVGTSAPYAITYSAPTAITATSSVANFCGTGGNTTITATSTAPYTYTFTPLLGATVTSTTANTADLAVTSTATIRVDGVDAVSGCAAQGFVSVGVYPLPSANLTTDVNGICPGTNANINSGLSAGNFTVASVPYAASTAPANAGVLMNNGTAVTPLAGGSMDDGGWSNIPIGFSFNYFGNNFTSISAGTNGMLMFGTPSGYGTGTGQLGQFTFQGPPYFPNAGNPANIIALLAADMHMGNSTTGSVKYWTEGYAPNRTFVIEYRNVRGYSSNPQATVQCKLYETLGNVEVHVFEKTFSNNAIIGLQDATQTVGAIAPGRAGAWTVTTPEGWRFTPPSNYTTVWTATNTTGTSTIASGTNIFTQAVSPTETTTYDISYTNQTTGCANAAGSAQTTIAVLGTVAPSNVNAIASDSSVCSGVDFQLSSDYTGSVDGLTFQWQYSTDNGQSFNDLAGATTSTFTTNVLVPTIFRLEVKSCGGTPAYTSLVSITMNAPTDCYCVPTMTYGCSDGDVVAGVKLNTLTNITGTACASGSLGYADYTADATLTTTLVPSTSYFCTVFAGDFSGNYAAWIDYNDDGVFDATERIGYTTSSVAAGDSVNFPVNISCNPNPGPHRLRVREVYATNGIDITPCGAYLWGETEDYIITLAPAPTCPSPGLVSASTSTTTSADITFPLGCATATNYDIEYGPAGFTQGTGTLLSNTAVTITGTDATYSLTGLTPNSTYDVYVRANCGGGDVSPWSIGTTVSTSCAPITLNNPGNQTACDSYTLPAITETTPSNNANMTMGYYNNPFGTGTPITGSLTSGQTLYIYASAGGCSSSASFSVVINHSSTSTTTETACDSYTWNGQTYTTSGTYTYTTQNAVGCDSTATLNLTINNSSTSTINAVACQSYTLNGTPYTTSGTYTQVLQNAVGCDSTITLNLTIGAPDAITVNQTACDSYTWNGTIYTTSGTYTANLQNVYGCDSTVTLNLTVNHSTTSTTNVNNCGAYTWNGQTYSASGTYTYHTTNATGCDSTATLVLTIGNNGSTQTAATCGSFTWSNGVTYTASGTYTQVVPNVAGCDSTITLNLTIYPLPNVTATDNGNGTLTASAGTSYQWINCQTNLPIGGATSQSLTVTQNGNYAVIVGNANNCTDTSNCVVVDYIGLDENSGFSLNVYPNPTDSKVTIAINGSSNEYDVVVEDMNGRKVATFNKLIHGNGNYDVNLSNLVTGVYFIKLTNGAEQRTVRVVKQ